MKYFQKLIASFLGVGLLLGGCASSEITQRQSYAAQELLPRPGRIIVYDFKASPRDLPSTSALTGYYRQRQTPQTAREVQMGRQLGANVGHRLVQNILKMGMSAQRAGFGPAPQIGDVLITGVFYSIEKGSRAKRVIIGFGKGSGELRTLVEGYMVTINGHRLLGKRQIKASGGTKPGLLVPGILTIATGSPVGLIVSATTSILGHRKGGSETLEGAGKRTADEVSKELKKIFRHHRWI